MSILNTALFVASCFGYLIWLIKRVGFNVFKAPFIFCCAIALTLCAFGMLGLLNAGSKFLLLTGLGLLVFEGYKFARSKTDVYRGAWVVCLVFLPFITLWLAIDKNFVFTQWDEFSFWASSTKLIYTTNTLFDQNSPIFFKTYPPIQQLFQYYLIHFIGWSERLVLYAQIFWLLSGLLCVAGSVVKDKKYSVLLFFLSCSTLYYFGYSFSSIYSDALMGVCFAACLALVLDRPRFSNYPQFILFLICVASLTLIKEIAVIFVAMVIAALIVQLFWSDLAVTTQARSSNQSLEILLRPTFVIAFIIIVVCGALLAWSLHIRSIDAARNLDLPSISLLSQPAWHSRITLTLTEFWSRLFKPAYLVSSGLVYSFGPTIFSVFFSLTGLGLALALGQSKTERIRTLLLVLVLALGALAYTLVLLLSYLFIFTEYEGVRLASFERYLSTYLMAWSLIVLAAVIDRLTARPTGLKTVCLMSLCCLVVLTAPVSFYKELRSIHSNGPAQQLRESIEQFANKAKQHMQESDKVYFIAQNSNGLERVMFYYAMLPYTSSTSWCWSIGEKYFEGDVWTCDTGLAELLKGYTYLALYRGDTQFWARAESMFKELPLKVTSGIFKIHREQNGSITHLEAMPASVNSDRPAR